MLFQMATSFTSRKSQMSDDGVVPADADADEVHLTDDEADTLGAYLWVRWDAYGPVFLPGLAILISCSLSIVFSAFSHSKCPSDPGRSLSGGTSSFPHIYVYCTAAALLLFFARLVCAAQNESEDH
jgi:hypothetical protein